MKVCSAYMCVLDSPGLELQTIVSFLVGAGN